MQGGNVIASRGINAYRQVEAQSRSPLELVVMLYDGALASLAEAGAAAERGDQARRRAGVSKALAIISSLRENLNFTQGGTLAQELDRLYDYATVRLLDVTLKHDVGAIAEIEILYIAQPEMTGAWLERKR